MPDRRAMRDAIVAEDDRTMRGSKPKDKSVEPLPERAPARGLEAHGFSKAEERAITRSADGGTPKTDMGSKPKSAQAMLEMMQGAGPK